MNINKDDFDKAMEMQKAFDQGAQSRQSEVDKLREKIKCYEKITLSLRNEFDLWSDDTESFNAIEAQIEILESLKVESHES